MSPDSQLGAGILQDKMHGAEASHFILRIELIGKTISG